MDIRNGKDYVFSYLFIGFTGDEQGVRSDEESVSQNYSLEQFNRFFSKNDITILKNMFLNLDMDFCDYFYEYDDCCETFLKGYEKEEKAIIRRKYLEETYSAVTGVYARLYNELPKEERKQVIKDFTKILTVMNIINYRIITLNKYNNYFKDAGVSKPFAIKKYVEQFTSSKVLQQRLMLNAIKEVQKLFTGKYGELNARYRVYYENEAIEQLKAEVFNTETKKQENEIEKE